MDKTGEEKRSREKSNKNKMKEGEGRNKPGKMARRVDSRWEEVRGGFKNEDWGRKESGSRNREAEERNKGDGSKKRQENIYSVQKDNDGLWEQSVVGWPTETSGTDGQGDGEEHEKDTG